MPNLSTRITKADVATILARGTLGAIPIVGPLAAEVVGALIPNQRLARIEQLLAELAKQIGNRDSEAVRQRFTSPEFIDLLEEGMVQSSRALSDDRIQRIAYLLSRSLTDEEISHIQDKRLLELLGRLNDAELVLLQSYTMKAQHDEDFQQRHKEVLEPALAYIGAPQDQIDNATLRDQFRDHLVQLGLLNERLRVDRETGLPEFDKWTGRARVNSREVSNLGQLLLRRVGLLDTREF